MMPAARPGGGARSTLAARLGDPRLVMNSQRKLGVGRPSSQPASWGMPSRHCPPLARPRSV